MRKVAIAVRIVMEIREHSYDSLEGEYSVSVQEAVNKASYSLELDSKDTELIYLLVDKTDWSRLRVWAELY